MKEFKVTKITEMSGGERGMYVYCENGDRFCIADGELIMIPSKERSDLYVTGLCSELYDICLKSDMDENNYPEYVKKGTRKLKDETKRAVAKAVLEYSKINGNPIIEFRDYRLSEEFEGSRDTRSSDKVANSSENSDKEIEITTAEELRRNKREKTNIADLNKKTGRQTAANQSDSSKFYRKV